jgi:hypothetical protein
MLTRSVKGLPSLPNPENTDGAWKSPSETSDFLEIELEHGVHGNRCGPLGKWVRRAR